MVDALDVSGTWSLVDNHVWETGPQDRKVAWLAIGRRDMVSHSHAMFGGRV